MTPYMHTLPVTFRAADYLPTRLLTRADDAMWLITQIVHKTASRDLDEWGMARLDSRVLARVMHRNTVSAVVEALECGAIEVDHGYIAGTRCKGYRLAKRFLGVPSVRRRPQSPDFVERVEREAERMRTADSTWWLPVHSALAAEQDQLTILPDAACRILSDLPAEVADRCRLSQSVLIDRLRRHDHHFTVSQLTGRVFNDISGLKRELRQAVRLDGEPLGHVDIRCAQPALLGLWLTGKIPSNGPKCRETYKHTLPAPLPASALPAAPCPDVLTFACAAAAGTFYERLIEATGMDRDAVKLGFLRDVLAKKGRYPSVVEAAFRDAFPSVYRIIRSVNQRDHGDLIRLLQRAESWLVIEAVAPRLLGRVPVVTLHDAIFSRMRDVPVVLSAFRETFAKLGCSLALKCE